MFVLGWSIGHSLRRGFFLGRRIGGWSGRWCSGRRGSWRTLGGGSLGLRRRCGSRREAENKKSLGSQVAEPPVREDMKDIRARQLGEHRGHQCQYTERLPTGTNRRPPFRIGRAL